VAASPWWSLLVLAPAVLGLPRLLPLRSGALLPLWPRRRFAAAALAGLAWSMVVRLLSVPFCTAKTHPG